MSLPGLAYRPHENIARVVLEVSEVTASQSAFSRNKLGHGLNLRIERNPGESLRPRASIHPRSVANPRPFGSKFNLNHYLAFRAAEYSASLFPGE